MALVAEALMDHARAGRIAFQVDSPTTRAEREISIASAVLATYAGADVLSRVVVTSSGSDPDSMPSTLRRIAPGLSR